MTESASEQLLKSISARMVIAVDLISRGRHDYAVKVLNQCINVLPEPDENDLLAAAKQAISSE